MQKLKMLKRIKLLKTITGRNLLGKLVIIAFTMGICGIALKFVKTVALSEFSGIYVFFPFFPNIIDCIFLIWGSLYLGWKAFKNA